MKKIIGIVLVLLMAMAVFAACGCNDGENGGYPNNQVTNGNENGEGANVPDTNGNENGNELNEDARIFDGTFAHGAEVITFEAGMFLVSGGEGHRHLPNGEGNFTVSGDQIEFLFANGQVETKRFAFDGNAIFIDGHRYPRR